jgi:alkyl hydroperoxide reductase subunit AhpC
MLMPRHKAPDLTVDTLAHGRFDLATDLPARMTLLVFYRGLHCPICAGYLKELERLTPAFAERGISTIAISSDGEERARLMAEKISSHSLRVGYGLPLTKAREWGLYISTSRGKTSIGIEEPALFSEPGLFLVRPDQTIYYLAVQSMPFARANFSEMLQAADFVIKNNYPARGEHLGPV